MKISLLKTPLLISLACLSVFALPLGAATVTWNGSGDGTTFSQDANWVGGVAPTAADQASFLDVMTSPTVVFTSNASVLGLWQSTSTFSSNDTSLVTFNLDGKTVSATSTAQRAGNSGAEALWINSSGGASGRAGQVNITDTATTKGKLSVTNFTVGATGDVGRKAAVLRVQGGAVLETLGGASVPTYIGRTGLGQVLIEGGATWQSADNITIGWTSFATGSSVRVTGAGSKWEKSAGTVGVGFTASHIYADNGGQISLLETTVGGPNSTAGSTAEISGAGTQFSATVFNLSGSGSNANGGAATFLVESGAVANIGQLNIFGPGTTSSPGTVDLRNAVLTTGVSSALHSTFQPDSNLAIRLFNPAQVASLVSLNNLTITNANLNISLDGAFSASLNQVIDLVRFDGSLTGQFAGLGEGAAIDIGDYSFKLSYGVDKPTYITLMTTAIPEPGSVGLVLLGAALLLWRRRVAKPA